MIRIHRPLAVTMGLLVLVAISHAQEESVKPGINDSFRDPDVNEFIGRFEVESREVFTHRSEIVAATKIQPGQTVADIGSGTGLFTRLFSEAVGGDGLVLAVDISQNFLDHIANAARESGQNNIQTILCSADSTKLPADSVDVAFICDTYHHFEFPLKTMASLYRAMKPGGHVIVIDFHRIEGTSSEWTLNHVRAGQEVFESEILETGFRKVREEKELLKDNYFVVFQKPKANASQAEVQRERGGGRGLGRGRGAGVGRGPGPEMRADQDIFHFLLTHHGEIRRSVKRLDNGVETLTESDNPEVAAKIQEHVASMHDRVKEGRGLRFWDELFVAIFEKYASIQMSVVNTEKGVKVRETSEDRSVVPLIQAHADVVSKFVAHGFDEAHRNHPVPKVPEFATASPKLEFPIIKKHGGVVARPTAVEQPRVGAQVAFDVTAAAKPEEINKGFDRVARLLNLYGAAGLKHHDVKITVVLHGDATNAALSDAAYSERFDVENNPNLPLIQQLREAGVEILVCGQALNYKGFADREVTKEIPIAASAMTVNINKQSEGYSFLQIQ
jgi:SAM-dependent methyltransferase/intracellular sulfur oxidation DsrE/DsrF family protein